MAKKNKKNKPTYLAVFRPAQHTLVITRGTPGPEGIEEVDYQTIATDIPEVADVQTFVRDALILVRDAGWAFPRHRVWVPRTVVRKNGEDTEWVWSVKRARFDVKLRMTKRDFEDMILEAFDSDIVSEQPDRFVGSGVEKLDPDLTTLYVTRGRAEGLLAKNYLRSNGWEVVEVWDTTVAHPDRPWSEPGPVLLTDRPWRPEVTVDDLKAATHADPHHIQHEASQHEAIQHEAIQHETQHEHPTGTDTESEPHKAEPGPQAPESE
ncbi:MAG: hypothetical protein V9E98_08380 [Candidatus Nanopelagicales bacterium]